jgi:hypothetical protein
MQKIRLAIRGWQRRREESEREFVARNASWAAAPIAQAPVAATPQRAFAIDVEGLTVAYLDDSGRMAHYLDIENGDVLDVPVDAALDAPQFRRVPSRTPQSDAADRAAFIESLDASPARTTLAREAASAENFRSAVAADRTIERAWYNFRNDRAIAAIEAWLETI